MVEYKCERCNKIYHNKYDYNRHLNRKRPCKSDDIQTNEKQHKITQISHKNPHIRGKKLNNKGNNDKNICSYCKKAFSRRDSLNRHISKYCKVKKGNDQSKEKIIEELLKERDEQKKEIEQIKMELNKLKTFNQKANTINNNTQNADKIQNNNTQNIINNKIKIIAYGKEDLSHILDKDYKMILNKGLKSVPALVEFIHFNKNKPENHNIYISNISNSYVLVYDGNEWQLKERDDVLQDMVYIKTDILSDKFDELLESLSEPIKRKFNRFLDNKDEDAVINSIKKDIKLLMYNKRKLVENTRNEITKNDNIKMVETK